MAEFKFPRAFTDTRGRRWNLVYSPDDESTMLPALGETSNVTFFRVDPLPVPGQAAPLHVLRIDVTIPGRTAGGRITGDKHLRLARVFEAPPLSPETVPPSEMAIYLEEAAQGRSLGSETQEWMYSLLGVAANEQKPEVDRAWPSLLAGAQAQAEAETGEAA